jgi:hypothetical protein
MSSMTKLYRAKTIVPELRGHRLVCLNWFVTGRVVQANRPYAELIRGYKRASRLDRCYAEGAIDELFSSAEAEVFLDWLTHYEEADTKIIEVPLLVARESMGFRAIPIGGPIDHLILAEVGGCDPATSPLGFTACGFFDLRDHEPIDKSVPARHQFCSIYIIDGKVVTDHSELRELWRAGKIVASNEVAMSGVSGDLPF